MVDFSIIIPAKNEEENIGRCLNSINSIDFERQRFEVLVIDNGSKDSTVDVAHRYGARVFVQPDLTIAGLRNFGANQSAGKTLVFLDADCTVKTDWLMQASRYMETPPVCFGSPPILPDNATWVQEAWFNIRKKKETVSEVEWLESMNMFIPRGIFFKEKGFNENLVTCEDFELSCRLRKHGKIISDQRIVAIHHGEAATLVHFFRKERWRATNNYQSLSAREVSISEWPSIILPVIQIVLLGVFSLLVVAFIFGYINFTSLAMYLFIWQLPLVCLSIWKLNYNFDFKKIIHLYILLNVYFFARGCTFFSKVK